MKIRTAQAMVIIFCLLSAGCATGISRQAYSQVTYRGAFSPLQANPGSYIGQTVLWGGRIIETKVTSTFTEITMLQQPLDTGDRPRDTDQSEGRFLIRSVRLLDPDIYQRGRPLTVVGRLIGSESRAIGDFNYVHPVLEPVEIRLWDQPQWRSPFFFNIGVGATF